MANRPGHIEAARGGLTPPRPGFQLVEASAGTGKTYHLATQYLLLLLHAGRTVDQILVVTFTIAATAELRDRIRSRIRELRDAIDAGAPDRIRDPDLRASLLPFFTDPAKQRMARQRLTDALASFDEATILTIHGFCTRVLGEQAFASGTSFELEVLQNDLELLETIVADFARIRLDRMTPEQYNAFSRSSALIDAGGGESWEGSGKLMSARMLKALRQLISNPFLEIIPEHPAPKGREEKGRKGAQAETEYEIPITRELIDFAREEFSRRKRESGAVAYDDMLLNVRSALAGPAGATLARELRETFTAALIDEFQDTDPVQYDIFRRIYEGSDAPVVFVGDPKQAIYRFRGADIFTYFEATRNLPPEMRSTLPVNHRSSELLVRGISDLFRYSGTTDIFRDGGKTEFPEVHAHHEMGSEPRDLPADRRGALHWFLFPDQSARTGAKEESPVWLKPQARAMAINATVEEIARLISSPVGEHPLTPGDIAVLVPTNREAREVQDALRAAGVPSVLKMLGDVFESDEAEKFLPILRAILAPQNESALSAALLSPYIGYTAADLFALALDPLASERAAAPFVRLREIWLGRRNGFIRMAMELLHLRGIGAGGKSVVERIGEFAASERTMTNLLHLIEVLHQESIRHPGSEHLVEWFERQVMNASPGPEERSIRLESDAKRVQIVTIHSSKGLEYPVVFCPFTWEGSEYKRRPKGAVVYHAHSKMIADIGSPARGGKLEKEELESESIRLLYVALTRARQRCYVVWGPAKNMQDAALCKLLLPGFDGRKASAIGLGYQGIVRPAKDLVARSEGMTVSVIGKRPGDIPPPPLPEPPDDSFRPRPFTRGNLYPSWNFASYTSLTTEWSKSQRDHDTAVVSAPSPAVRGTTIHTFPAGARTGIAWHGLFEQIDFRISSPEILPHVIRTLKRDGFGEEYAPAVAEMVRLALSVPVTGEGGTLRDLAANESLREMEFTFRLDRYRTADLRRVLTDPKHSLPDEFRLAATRMQEKDLAGFMTGAIDLLFRHGGKYYLLDYKSNMLGDSPDAYQLPRIREVMAREHYYLQYLIYSVAVHRFLHRRVHAYSYERDFGGVTYLFLRGLPEGVFLDRPPASLIEALDALFAGRGE